MRSIPKIVAVGCAVATLAAVGAVPASAGTAHPAMCPPDKGYDFSGSYTYYRDMEPRSGGDSGTTISITFHKGKTTTSTVGGTVGAEAKVVFAKASATFDYHFAWQWTNDSTYTWSWKVPDTMRHGYLHAGVKARYTKWNLNTTEPNCTTKVLEKGTAHLVYQGRETWHGAS
ncbi:hypothetical protein AB0N07_40175 [Streptomyces sp. NPDC051172]|uniref:hypothetical protein n=1 Tax=Streptomyces sp. NPDC051172 TaxID=3155796 RepID=UPI00344A112F